MKKFFCSVFFCAIFLSENVNAKQINFGNDKPILRADTAKMIALTYCSKKEIIDMYKSRSIDFTDTNTEKWYDKYINTAFKKQIMSGVGEKFEPEKPLTLIQAQYLLDKINQNNETTIKITDENKNKCISYSLWTKLFIEAIKNLDKKIEQKKIIILATPSQNKNIPQNNIVTNEKYYICDGIDFDFLDKSTEIIANDNEIIAVLNFDDEFDLKCSAIKQTGNKIFISSGPVKRFFNLKKQKKIAPGNYILKIKSGEIINISPEN